MKWFEVDKQGLAKLLERKGKQFVLYELIQNAWDERATQVRISIKRIVKTPYVLVTVEDNNPEGFADLSHAFTLFAESNKKGDAEKRGRFNLGEKLVLALCESATIHTTKGLITFDAKGRSENYKPAARLAKGSVFSGKIQMSDEELQGCDAAIARLIPPANIETFYQGVAVPWYEKAAELNDIRLPTEVSDTDGYLRKAWRSTSLEVYRPQQGEPAMLYEMGIPVVETGDKWHINVTQKVPLNFDRDNVPPAYLSRVRAAVIELMSGELDSDDANSAWVRDAFQRHGDTMPKDVVSRLLDLRFGKKRVSFDPSDPEANSLAVMGGYVVVHGPQLSKSEWDVARAADAIKPAGQVTPSPNPNGKDDLKKIPPEKYTAPMKAFVSYAQRVARRILGAEVSVTIANDVTWGFYGAYAPGHLTVNAARFGHAWFEGSICQINDFLIHEYGHHYARDHLSHEYHDALCRLGGQLTQLALEEPQLFDGPWMWNDAKEELKASA